MACWKAGRRSPLSSWQNKWLLDFVSWDRRAPPGLPLLRVRPQGAARGQRCWWRLCGQPRGAGRAVRAWSFRKSSRGNSEMVSELGTPAQCSGYTPCVTTPRQTAQHRPAPPTLPLFRRGKRLSREAESMVQSYFVFPWKREGRKSSQSVRSTCVNIKWQ